MENMRDLLRGSLGRSLRTLSDIDRLSAAWPVACGPSLASHATVLHLDVDRILHVRVTGAEWLLQFQRMRSALANDLGRIAGVRIVAIRFDDTL